MKHTETPTDLRMRVITLERLHLALDRLGLDQMAVLHLHFWEDQEIEEIALRIGKSERAVRHLIQYSLDGLRACLERREAKFPIAKIT